MRNLLPIIAVLVAILAIWTLAVVPMNIQTALNQAERAGQAVKPDDGAARRATSSFSLIAQNPTAIAATYGLDRPRLPSPAQVARELWDTTVGKRITSKQSLIFHGWITLRATLNGFLLGTILGVALAVAIVSSRVMELGVMPWAVTSQTIPIVAIAPMIIVLVSATGIEGRGLPKAIIAAYLCFFPVLVSMIKGLRSPDAMQLDLLKTYSASPVQVFWKLRVPSSLPYFFASLKIGIAAALVGTIVGELPTGAVRGLGARILIGDQFGTPIKIWSALAATAILAGALVATLSLLERMVSSRFGGRA